MLEANTGPHARAQAAVPKEIYEAADRRVAAKLGFYRHLAVYAAVSAGLVVINLLTSAATLWFVWPLLGWGIGVLCHGVGLFVKERPSKFKQRMLDAEVRRLRQHESH